MLIATIFNSALTWIIIIAVFVILLFVTVDFCERTQRKNMRGGENVDGDDDKDECADEDLEENEDADEDEFDEEDEALLTDAILTTLALHHSFKKKDKKGKRNDWETHCEFYGDPLEDCRCEHKHESRRDSGFSVHDDSDEDDHSHFDDFRSF